MTREQIYQVWAPDEAIWLPWAKPVLFAHLRPGMETMAPAEELPVDWAPPADGRTAIVIDLAAAASVWRGLSLARIGYRPVPLYNAVLPEIPQPAHPMVVDLAPIMAGLYDGAEILCSLRLPLNAPPAFLLDASRRYGHHPADGSFDNRSVSLPTDFPSANRLLSAGIRRVIFARQDSTTPQADLAHTLVRWQEAGIEIATKDVHQPGPPIVVEIARPAFYRSLFQRLAATLGLRRSPLGGFGGLLPMPSAG